jgi:hypothetical protein
MEALVEPAKAIVAINLNPDARTLRTFGFIGFAVFATAAYLQSGMLMFEGGATQLTVARSLAVVGVYCGACSLLAPRLNRPVYVAIGLVTYPIGVVTSYVLLAVVFFGVFLPVGAGLRLVQRAGRKNASKASSYWHADATMRRSSGYFRPF